MLRAIGVFGDIKNDHPQNIIKIVWAVPKFDDCLTGGQKVFLKLKDDLIRRAMILEPSKIEFNHSRSIQGQIIMNIKNFKALLPFDKSAFVFQDLLCRRSFILANIFLHIFFRRKIIIFVNQDFVDLSKASLKGKIILSMMYYVFFKTTYRIIVNSKSTARWVNCFGNFRKKIYVLYPILKNDLWVGERLRDSDKGNGVMNLLCVGNIRKKKGQDYLIEALSFFKRREVRLILAGAVIETDYYDYLLDKIRSRGLGENVNFCGFLKGNKLADTYRSADIFILPSLNEPFGMVLIEAMSFGLPIIASNAGGVPEIIDDGINGLLISPASVGDLVACIERLIKDKELREYLGIGALRKYYQFPDWEQSFKSFYESCLTP